MIISAPTANKYFIAGKELFDFSWDVVARLLTSFDQAADYGIDPDEISEKCWRSARGHLTTTISITQQGLSSS